MKKNIKKLYVYGLIMIVCVIVIVLIAWMSDTRVNNYQSEYETQLTARQSEIDVLQKRIAELEDKNSELEKTNKENIDALAKLDKYSQTMNDLTEVYKLFKDGKEEEAKNLFSQLDTTGYDDGALAFYETLKEILQK